MPKSPKSNKPYPPEFREKVVALARTGRTPAELSREFGLSAQSIRYWIAQADRDAGRRDDGLTSAEREELAKLRRKVKTLELEREILSKAAAWFARETNTIPSIFGFVKSHQAEFPVATMCASQFHEMNQRALRIYAMDAQPRDPLAPVMWGLFALLFGGFGVYQSVQRGRIEWFLLLIGLVAAVLAYVSYRRAKGLQLNC